MDDVRVRQKAQVAIAFQSQPEKMFSHYVRTRWKRQVLVTAVFAGLIAAAWATQQQFVAVGLFGLWAGRLMRDYQWFWYLAAEWQTTRALIDWPKAEALARGTDAATPS